LLRGVKITSGSVMHLDMFEKIRCSDLIGCPAMMSMAAAALPKTP
jgi:hypothetical protein